MTKLQEKIAEREYDAKMAELGRRVRAEYAEKQLQREHNELVEFITTYIDEGMTQAEMFIEIDDDFAEHDRQPLSNSEIAHYAGIWNDIQESNNGQH